MRPCALLTVLLATSCARAPRDTATATDHAHHAGDRTGIHGMVLFGRSHYYLEHIPMFSRPHDEQLVMRVSIKTADGAPVTNDFSDEGYSIQPTSPFSLDDLILGKRTAFDGNIHRGNFEDNGPLLIANAKITIDHVLVSRPLPGSEPNTVDFFLLGDAGDLYATNIIRDTRGFQQILRVTASDGVVPSSSKVLPVKAGSLTLGKELWCLKAPDFVARCD